MTSSWSVFIQLFFHHSKVSTPQLLYNTIFTSLNVFTFPERIYAQHNLQNPHDTPRYMIRTNNVWRSIQLIRIISNYIAPHVTPLQCRVTQMTYTICQRYFHSTRVHQEQYGRTTNILTFKRLMSSIVDVPHR